MTPRAFWASLLATLRAALPATSTEAIDTAERLPAGWSRRQFLRTALVGATVAATVDVERLLWTPGERTWFLPPAPTRIELAEFLSADWIAQESLRILHNQMAVMQRLTRPYNDEPSSLGDHVQVRLPQQWQDPLNFDPSTAVLLDTQFSGTFNPQPTRQAFLEREVTPAMKILAAKIEAKGLDVFGRLARSVPGVPDAQVADARAADGTGPILRIVEVCEIDKDKYRLRYDVLGGKA